MPSCHPPPFLDLLLRPSCAHSLGSQLHSPWGAGPFCVTHLSPTVICPPVTLLFAALPLTCSSSGIAPSRGIPSISCTSLTLIMSLRLIMSGRTRFTSSLTLKIPLASSRPATRSVGGRQEGRAGLYLQAQLNRFGQLLTFLKGLAGLMLTK